jgi:DNA-binding transcriptional regulator LsrR (DeoR family)
VRKDFEPNRPRHDVMRCIAITTDQLRQIPDVMALAAGAYQDTFVAAAT